MGQKTDFNPDEWDLLDELSDDELSDDEIFDAEDLDSSIFVKVDKHYDSLKLAQDPSEIFEDPAELVTDLSSEKSYSAESSEKQRKIIISRRNTGKPISAQEEDAFRKQIQDLFDLLELEKEDLKEGVRVYQTDSSPSMPWRFH